MTELPTEEFLLFIDGHFYDMVSKDLGFGGEKQVSLLFFKDRIQDKLKEHYNKDFFCKRIFYYTAPPYQSNPPSEDESRRMSRYDLFKLYIKDHGYKIGEGRHQVIKKEGKIIKSGEKAVDAELIMDLIEMPIKYKVKSVVIVTSDTDFVAPIKRIKNRGIKTFVFSYWKKDGDKFKLSDHLRQNSKAYFIIESGFFKKEDIIANEIKFREEMDK
ncbi:MAG: NYN domain-containing protein [Candidatus Parvarchaeota archaeon]|nr:NYN domain-containing protein [Candidatus Parvarchaeum tengchongense]MCW1295968.1 NYN domain-containing protein [Candidatus Parvarchaeum tengchongense]MCW1298828.1 NYN domain-containing protein [Candidatus Parvarchaeum tengchongense]MCW1312914.1 NYN domain-containing protein [Candidatus Parvarchaeum tengchongense]